MLKWRHIEGKEEREIQRKREREREHRRHIFILSLILNNYAARQSEITTMPPFVGWPICVCPKGAGEGMGSLQVT